MKHKYLNGHYNQMAKNEEAMWMSNERAWKNLAYKMEILHVKRAKLEGDNHHFKESMHITWLSKNTLPTLRIPIAKFGSSIKSKSKVHIGVFLGPRP